MLCRSLHFNNGSIGATPRAIVEAHKAYIDRFETNPYTYAWSGFSDKKLVDVTPKAAGFLNAGPDEILLTRNTTEGMNLISTGMRLKAGDEILTTDHEHAGGINRAYAKSLARVSRRLGGKSAPWPSLG
mgnify:CR=1 FL=1